MTLLNFFVNEYSPASYEGLRIMTWVLNFFGMFFVLAAHEHYTIDVVVAFYISSRMFAHYHDLANSITATNPLKSIRKAVCHLSSSMTPKTKESSSITSITLILPPSTGIPYVPLLRRVQ